MTDPTKPGDPADKQADGAFGGVTSHRAGYGDKLQRVEDWVRRHPTATLASGEGAVLLAEIDRLRDELDQAEKAYGTCDMENAVLYETRDKLYEENAQLRAAIERGRALHASVEIGFGPICDECSSASDGWIVPYPCPTLRAIDGEAA
jgi:hypothetical protein